jgi:hypothetical protein
MPPIFGKQDQWFVEQELVDRSLLPISAEIRDWPRCALRFFNWAAKMV